MQTNHHFPLVALWLCFSMTFSQVCLAVDLPPPSLPPPPVEAVPAGAPSGLLPPVPSPSPEQNQVVNLEVSEGQDTPEKAIANKVAAPGPLSVERVQDILKRLPPEPVSKPTGTFNIPDLPSPPPKPGGIVSRKFPPDEPQRPGKKPVLLPLAICRHSPEGKVSTASQVTLTFTEPMIALSAEENPAAAAAVPVRIAPCPPGKWRWQGTQTLRFEPDGKRLPGATTYKLDVPAGSKSALGNQLKESFSWTITTAPARVETFFPNSSAYGEDIQPPDPLMLAVFNQAVKAAEVLKTVQVSAGKVPYGVRLAAAEEIRADRGISRVIKTLSRDRWVAFKPVKALPLDKAIQVQFGPSLPSAEGPLLSKGTQVFNFHTYSPLTVRTPEGSLQPGGVLWVAFNNPLDSSKFKPSMVHISPALANTDIRVQGRDVYLKGALQADTKYSITFDSVVQDKFGQRLGSARTVVVKVGGWEPQLIEPERELVVLQPSKQPAFVFRSCGLKQVKATIYEARPQDYRRFLASREKYQEWHNRPEQYGELQGFKKITSKLVLPSGKSGESINENQIDLSPYLHSGLGHVIATVEKWPRTRQQVQRFAVWLECTHIGLDAFSDGSTLVAMATKLEDGAPVNGAEVFFSEVGSASDKDAAKQPESLKASPKVPAPVSKAKTKGGVAGKAEAIREPGTSGNPAGESWTDRAGLARLALGPRSQGVLICRHGKDEAFLPSQYDRNWASPKPADSVRWYCVTDRHLYKPGEQVQVKGWARRFGAGARGDISLLDRVVDSIQYKINDTRGTELAKGETAVDRAGGFTFSFSIPKSANLGDASIILTAARNKSRVQLLAATTLQSFNIQEFRRPEFEMTVKSREGNSILPGDVINLVAKARYFSGGSLPDAAIHWGVRASESEYAPPHWSDFAFGKQKNLFFCLLPHPGDEPSSQSEISFDGTTDSAGQHVLKIKSSAPQKPFPVSIVAEGTVSDVNRQSWSESATILLHPADVYVGLRSDKQFYHADDPIKIESIVSDLDGGARAGKQVHLQVTKTRYQWMGDGYKTGEDTIAVSDLTSALQPAACNLDLKEGGNIKVIATVKDDKGRSNQSQISFWREEQKSEQAATIEEGKILIIPDKQKYAVGDTAELALQAPFPKSHGVVTVRKHGLASATPVELTGPSSTIKIPISEEFMPNASIQVDLVGANCKYASGSVDLKVPPVTREIKIEVAPADMQLSPGAKTHIAFTLKDPAGNPAAKAQIAVAVVDESLLAMDESSAWSDPLSYFYTATTPGTDDNHGRQYIILKNSRKPILREYRRTKGFGAEPAASMPPPPVPGPGLLGAPVDPRYGQSVEAEAAPAPQIAIRKNFDALAYFNPGLQTDEKGNASCEIKLPDNLTRYRIMAVAASGAGMFGKGESTLTARLPLMVRPAAPRFLNFGDQCLLPVVVQNQTAREMSVELAIRSDNLNLSKEAAGHKGSETIHSTGATVLVPPNDRVEVRFPAATENDGEARLDIAAVSEENTDAASVTLPVYTPASSQAVAAEGQIDAGGVEQVVSVPQDVFEQIGGLELSTSSTALQSLTDAYIYLHDYSFLCSEQLSSRVLATSALQNVLSAFHKVDEKELSAIKAQVQGDIKALCQRQNGDGSFGLWKRDEKESWPFLSIQVARSLYQAREKGYQVEPSVLNACKSYLRSIEQHIPKNYDLSSRRSTIAYALFVRFLAKDADPDKARALIDSVITAPPAYKTKAGGKKAVHATASDLGEQGKLTQSFSLEAISWLLPVISADKASLAETALARAVLAAHINETSSHAESEDDVYSDDAYCLFYSPARRDAAILEALLINQPENSIIPKLAKSLLGYRKAGRWESTQENSAALVALDRYFSTVEKVAPDFTAKTWLGPNYVGQSRFAGRSTATQVVNVPMSFLKSHSNGGDFLLSKEGRGKLYYRLALSYAPRRLELAASDNGFSIKRRYEAVDDPGDVIRDASGTWHIKAGAAVKTVIEFVAPGRRYHVALTDPLPAGMEAVNTALSGAQKFHKLSGESTKSETAESDDKQAISERAAFFPWWSEFWFEHQNLRDFRAEAFASNLWSGKYNYSYLSRATTPGEYLVPPARVEEMYSPETYARTASEHVVIE